MSAWQITHLLESISPGEYDAAVMRSPELCPLLAAEDLRSGRQVGEKAGVKQV
jgi:hypothetical protein